MCQEKLKTMKKTLALGMVSLMLSCTAKKTVHSLPKDISQKPPREAQADIDAENIITLKTKIDSLASSVRCSNPSDWRISPIGSKPCGGPAAYMAYPKQLEEELLPMIRDYTQKQSDYNRKKGLLSDCAIVPAPSGIRCENGKPLLKEVSAEVY